jgi:hypothetical protein
MSDFNNLLKYGGAAGVIICVSLSIYLSRIGKDFFVNVSTTGSVASLIALVIAIAQIASLQRTTLTIEQVVRETRSRMVQNLALSDVSEAIELIKFVQLHVGTKRLEVAYLRLQDLRKLLLQFRRAEHFLPNHEKQRYNNLLRDLGFFTTNLYDALYSEQTELDILRLHNILESISDFLVAYQADLIASRGNNDG